MCQSSVGGDNPHVASADPATNQHGIQHGTPAKPFKGRKRFTADLSELRAHPESIARSGQWSVKSVKPGDEEASVEIFFENHHERKAQTVILIVSDSSQYPMEHTYFGYSQDAGALESKVARVIDKLPTQIGHTLQQAVEFFVEGLSNDGKYTGDDAREADEPENEDDFMVFDDDFERSGYLPSNSSQTIQAMLGHLQKEFIEVKAAGYNPGIAWTGSKTFILSVSLPVSDLYHHILPHALLAWDRRFLEPGLHFTLLISGCGDVYPVLQQDGTLVPNLVRKGFTLKFKVGFTKQYKPSRHNATAAFREFFLKTIDKNEDEDEGDLHTNILDLANDPDLGVFRRMSLSTSLESLLDQHLLQLVQLRRRFNLGWAGAEELLWQIETAQQDPATLFFQKKQQLESAELDETNLSHSNNLLRDPIDNDSELNLLKISFAFLLRRLALSTRHCVVCHKKLGSYEALRPYVCNSGLCVFQYYSLNLGPSIEHEIITNTGAVDLLVSLAYVSAAEGTLYEPLPVGMGLRVRRPTGSTVTTDVDGHCEFDSLGLSDMRKAITDLLATLPAIKDIKEYLQRQYTAGNTKVRLRDMGPDVPPAAWSVLRWCVASCTAHIQELTSPEDCLRNMGNYRQFRFLVGAPDEEKKFLSAMTQGDHPSLFAFHGSPLKNWHSIIRHGLWFKNVAHGRAHGNGVYFCQDASVSLSGYAIPSSTVWKNSMTRPSSCCTLAELVNRRHEFVYNAPPYFVVNKTEWIMCRYLLVRTMDVQVANHSHSQACEEPKVGKYLRQERNLSTMNGSTTIDVPQPSYQLDKLVRVCIFAREKIDVDDDDRAIFEGPREEPTDPSPSVDTHAGTKQVPVRGGKVWKPDEKWILRNAKEVLPPPTDSSLGATTTLQREFRTMMREQATALEVNDLGTLGWYLPPQHNEDNLYQWLVELHSFDPELPVAKDMKSKGVSSVAVEIRFPPSFPHAPPFFRVIRPRFKPFMEGGGGHVTVGGSICMDLLTSDGWLPGYCVSSVLLQIKLAISSTTPYPARLQNEWDRAYTPEEALRGYIRAAGIHNWKVKNEAEIRKLMMARSS